VTIATLAQARILESWQHYQAELMRVVAPLTAEQMRYRLVPGQRSIGEIATHIVFARAKWLPPALAACPAELEPLLRWDAPDDPPHTPAEVVQGLDLTWRLMAGCLARWEAAGLRAPADEAEVARLRTIWGLLEHDLHHGGELSFVLGACGLPALDI
jgi:DinB family protein